MSTLTITLCLTLTITLLSPWPCLGQTSQETGWRHQRVQAQEGRCDIRRLTATEARRRIRAEGGVTEIWDAEDQQFRCAGVAALSHVIEPGGLFLPSYTNAPYLTYVVQGSGIQGVIMPGCPETYQSVPATTKQERRGEGGEGRSVGDQHQKVVRIRKGDVIASPVGVVQWTYNDGDTAIISVTLLDISNSQNQLDRNIRNAMMVPHWKINGHGIMYITRGSGRIQVVRDNGELVFDDRVQEGQLLVIPQNYVAMKKAGREGLEWVGFFTSNHPMISPLSGRLSIIKAIPEEVLMNSYGISREQTKRLKSSGGQEMTLFTPGRSRDPYSIV